jgi:hypothetical protein
MIDPKTNVLPDVLADAFFRALELRRTQALVDRDMETLEQLHAPEYQLITPAGRVFERRSYLAAIAEGPFYRRWEAKDMAVRQSPKMAIVRYQARLEFPSGNAIDCWHTDSYELRAGQWQAVWSQATAISPPASTPNGGKGAA